MDSPSTAVDAPVLAETPVPEPLRGWSRAGVERFTTCALACVGSTIALAVGARVVQLYEVRTWLEPSTVLLVPMSTAIVTVGVVKLARRMKSAWSLVWLGPLAGVLNTAFCAGLLTIAAGNGLGEALGITALAAIFGLPVGGCVGFVYAALYGPLLGYVFRQTREDTVPLETRAGELTLQVLSVVSAWMLGVSILGRAFARGAVDHALDTRPAVEGYGVDATQALLVLALAVAGWTLLRTVRVEFFLKRIVRGEVPGWSIAPPIDPAGADGAPVARMDDSRWVVRHQRSGDGPFRSGDQSLRMRRFESQAESRMRMGLLATLLVLGVSMAFF